MALSRTRSPFLSSTEVTVMKWSQALCRFSGRLLGRPTKPKARRFRRVPTVQALENRWVPSTMVVMGAPVANDDWADTDGSTPVAVSVLTNDSASAVPGSIAVVAAPKHGTAVANPTTGEITYTANEAFTGSDT